MANFPWGRIKRSLLEFWYGSLTRSQSVYKREIPLGATENFIDFPSNKFYLLSRARRIIIPMIYLRPAVLESFRFNRRSDSC